MEVVLLGVRGDVFEGPQDPCGDRMRCRKVVTLWLESILIGDVAQAYRGSVIQCITVRSLDREHVVRLVQFPRLSGFLYPDAVSSLIAEGVRAIWVGPVRCEVHDRDWCVLHWRGNRRCREESEEGASLEEDFSCSSLGFLWQKLTNVLDSLLSWQNGLSNRLYLARETWSMTVKANTASIINGMQILKRIFLVVLS